MMILKIPNENKMLELNMVLSSTSKHHIDNMILDTSLHDQQEACQLNRESIDDACLLLMLPGNVNLQSSNAAWHFRPSVLHLFLYALLSATASYKATHPEILFAVSASAFVAFTSLFITVKMSLNGDVKLFSYYELRTVFSWDGKRV